MLRSISSSRFFRFLALIVGFILMVGVTIRIDNDVSEEDRAIGIEFRKNEFVTTEKIDTLSYFYLYEIYVYNLFARCLSSGGRMNWQAIRNENRLKVCLTKVLAGMDQDEAMSFLEGNGFHGVFMRQIVLGRNNVSATCGRNNSSCSRILPNELWPFSPYSYTIQAEYLEETLINVRLTFIVK